MAFMPRAHIRERTYKLLRGNNSIHFLDRKLRFVCQRKCVFLLFPNRIDMPNDSTYNSAVTWAKKGKMSPFCGRHLCISTWQGIDTFAMIGTRYTLHVPTAASTLFLLKKNKKFVFTQIQEFKKRAWLACYYLFQQHLLTPLSWDLYVLHRRNLVRKGILFFHK